MASALLCGAFFTACDDNDEKPVFPENQENVYDMSGFAKGADVSWLTEMEKSGYKFYDAEGNEKSRHEGFLDKQSIVKTFTDLGVR